MRPKSSPQSNNLQPQSPYDAWFYTLVSSGTKEVEFSAKRRQYLVDQGFTFEMVTDLLERVDLDPLSRNYTYATTADDETLLSVVLSSEKDAQRDQQREDRIIADVET